MHYAHVLQATRALRVHVRPSSFRSLLLSKVGDFEARSLVHRINFAAETTPAMPGCAATARPT